MLKERWAAQKPWTRIRDMGRTDGCSPKCTIDINYALRQRYDLVERPPGLSVQPIYSQYMSINCPMAFAMDSYFIG